MSTSAGQKNILPTEPGDRQTRVEVQFCGPDPNAPTVKWISLPSFSIDHIKILDAKKGIVQIGEVELRNVMRLRLYELVGVPVTLLGIPMGTGCERENQTRWHYVMGEFRTPEQHKAAKGNDSMVRYLSEMQCSGIIMVNTTGYPLYPGERFIG